MFNRSCKRAFSSGHATISSHRLSISGFILSGCGSDQRFDDPFREAIANNLLFGLILERSLKSRSKSYFPSSNIASDSCWPGNSGCELHWVPMITLECW
jgi:hypothetical protein